ncbi:MAG: MarR family winged helix-turn-helix transcriptional regulator [Beijerinckiaceae bacterium]
MTSAGFLASQASRLFSMNLQNALRPLGLAPAQFMVLIDLADGSRRTQRDLAERLDVEQPTMANTLARMERDRLILRVADERDRRVVHITATPKAHALYREAAKAVQSVNERATQGMTTEERLRFLGTLARMIENLRV